MLNKRKIEENEKGKNHHKYRPIPNNQILSIQKMDYILIFTFCKHRTTIVLLKAIKNESDSFRVLLFLFLIKTPQCEVHIS